MSAQRLVAFLALHERPISRVYLAGVLGRTAHLSGRWLICGQHCGVRTISMFLLCSVPGYVCASSGS